MTGEALSLEEDSTLEVSGEGQVEFFGDETDTGDFFGSFERVRLEAGERTEIRRTTEGLQFDETNFFEDVSIGEAPTEINLGGEAADELSLTNESGKEITFSPDDEAVVSRQDGQLVFENRTASETLRVDSGEDLTVAGDAEARVSDGIEFEQGDRLEATISGTDATLTNRTTIESVDVAEGNTRQSPLEANFGLLSNPRSEQVRLFGAVLTRLF